MNPVLASQLLAGPARLAVVGLGYVGLPLALAFAKKGVSVIGFDIQPRKIARLRDGIDDTGEASAADFAAAAGRLVYTENAADLRHAALIIVTVPTPIDQNKNPDLGPLTAASQLIGRHVAKGATVVFESTVYPGVTEEHCVPLIEQASGFKLTRGDFFVGYSPERINPGDKEYTLARITKVVSGHTPAVCEALAGIYGLVVEAGIHRAESIKVAEAAKVIENTQRDLNIALMNELAMIFEKLQIPTEAVLRAAGTKWNFLRFRPGLVGGHCIGVDPYYLTSKAEQLGYWPEVVLAGRRINDAMGAYVAQQTIKQMVKAGKHIEGSRVCILGLTFKENVPDVRNSKVFDIIRELNSYGTRVSVYDPFVTPEQVTPDGFTLLRSLDEAQDLDVLILATAHQAFRAVSLAQLWARCRKDHGTPVLIDVRWMYDRAAPERQGFHYWRL